MANPQLTTNDIAETLIQISRSQVAYISMDTVDFAKYRKSIDDLIRINPADGWALKGMLYALAGEEKTMRDAFKNSFLLSPSVESRLSLSGCLAILGYFSEAQKELSSFLLSEPGFLASNIDRAAQSGMFCLLADQITEAKEKGMAISIEEHEFEEMSTAARILKREGITDDQVAEQLDLVGEVLRSRNMIVPQIRHTALDMTDIFVGVVIEAIVPADADTVVSMNIELAELIVKRGAPMHERLSVLFSQRVQL